jgi:hypothetical protein
MTTPKDNGGPAFPSEQMTGYISDGFQSPQPVWKTVGGLTVRDWFAGQALQGVLMGGGRKRPPSVSISEWASWEAFDIADAMMKERSK